MSEVICQICHQTAKGLTEAIHEIDILPSPSEVRGIEYTTLIIKTALLKGQIDDMVGDLDSDTKDCRPSCAVRQLLRYLLTGKGPKLPDDEQPQFDLR